MSNVTTIKLKRAGGRTATFFHFHHWYVEIGDGYVDHFDHRLRTNENFDNTQENEHFCETKPYTKDDKERFKKDVLEQEKFLKESVGSLSKAFRMYNDPTAE